MNDDTRFSVLLLENDIMELRTFREKLNKHANNLNTYKRFFFLNYYKNKHDYYYHMYIKKLHYIERKYRCTHIYTKYHENLEKKYIPEAVEVCNVDEIV
tara:strand:+ start:7749 stop:8045 length:297 start_codon:yes stop_codon:yes gene_type:complete